MFSEAYCVAVQGIEGHIIQVEADISDGLPCFSLVGFLSSEVKEARERVRIAIKNCGFRLPPKKITVNLSPADLRKDGTGYDLAIAMAILAAFGYVSEEELKKMVLLGELSLDGQVKGITGVLPMVYAAYEQGIRQCIVPEDNVSEASVAEGMQVAGVSCLQDAVALLQKNDVSEWKKEIPLTEGLKQGETPDFVDVKGQAAVRRAVEVAVAGRHNLLMLGPPGSGKTMIAKRIPGIMPPIEFSEQMEISKVYSVAGLLDKEHPYVTDRPFRTPHHTVSQVALAGGGRYPRPGEVSLANGGVLFLDELPEFQRQTIEVLRQPLEDGYVTVSRLEGTYRYPARFQLVAAANPCPCGYYPDQKRCTCTPWQIRNYLGKISQPILDRIDICTETIPLKYREMEERGENRGYEASKVIRDRILTARKIQTERYRQEEFLYNADLPPGKMEQYCGMDSEAKDYFCEMYEHLSFTARGYHKIIKVARSIADLEGTLLIQKRHISEAIGYRMFDKAQESLGRQGVER